MPSRSFKRVLVGETSLERKCRWWFGIALGVLLVLSFYWSGQKLRDFLRDSDRKLGRELVRAAFLERHFEHMMAPDPAESAANDADTNDAWNDLIAGVTEQRTGERYRSYALRPQGDAENPLSVGAPQYDYERDLLKFYIDSGPTEMVDRIEDGEVWRFYQPIYAEKQSCVTCHNLMDTSRRRPLSSNDLIAVMRIEVDRGESNDEVASYDATMWAVAVTIFFLSMFLLWFIVKLLIVKPVTHLRDVTNAVREGDTSQRADIQTGDEFEELAASFNRMLRQLLSQQNALESVNAALDGKVDELAQMNLRLFEMNRLKSDFLATMSHELRTPLNSIIGFSDVLATVDALEPKQQRYVSNIQRSGRMLLEMINDILDLAKLESGRMDAAPSEFPVAAVVTAQCDMARPLAERKHIDLVATCPPQAPPLRQDQSKLQQVLNNLLSNAIKFTPEGGRILVRACREPDTQVPGAPRGSSGEGALILEVEDTGIGISDADQSIIFEKFRQGASAAPQGDAMTREQGGTGLGLSIVRELCRLLGGDVSVRSVSGKGSTFIVRLPWRLPDRTDLDAELNRGVAELTRPSAPLVTDTPGATPAPAAAG